MAIDIQIYKGEVCINHKTGVAWDEAHDYLREKEARLKEKSKTFSSIEIQVYTSQDMPVDSAEVKTFEEAHIFLVTVLDKANKGEYRGVFIIK